MSMLSSQIDALREASRTYQRMGNRSASNMLRDAADTIWQLRDDLQRANAENAKLRELVSDMWHEGMCECGSLGKCATCVYEYRTRMRELGVEVSE